MRLLYTVATLFIIGALYGQSSFQLDVPPPCSSCFNNADTSTVSACESYLSPSGKVWTQSGLYFDTLQYVGLCDSIIPYDLNVTKIDVSIQTIGDKMLAVGSADSYQWVDCSNNQSIAGATDSIFTPSQSGQYKVILNKSGCSDTSDCVNIIITSLANSTGKSVIVYPNPSDGQVTVDFGTNQHSIQAILLNPLGQEVFERTYNQIQRFTIPLPKSAGLYTLQLNSIDGEKTSFAIIRK